MDKVFVRGLEVETVIGVYDWERKITQKVIIDLEMGCDVAAAAATDKIEDALNYKEVTKKLEAFVGDSRFQLVESLAEGIAQLLTGELGIPWVRLEVNKRGALSSARDVGVIIERGERG